MRRFAAAGLAAYALAAIAASVASAQTEPPHRAAYAQGAALVAGGHAEEAYPLFADAARAADAAGDTAVAVRARRVLAQMDYNHGTRLVWLRRVADAVPYFEAGLANDPDNPRNGIGLGTALGRLGRDQEAVEAFRRAVAAAERRPDHPAANEASVAFREHFHAPLRGYLDRSHVVLPAPLADAMLARLALADSNGVADDETRYLRSRALLALGRASDALAVADAFIERHRGTQAAAAPFQYVRGEALRALGRPREAGAAYRAARHGRFAPWADERLSGL